MNHPFLTIPILLFSILLLTGCKSSEKTTQDQALTLTYTSHLNNNSKTIIQADITWGEAFNHPSFAIWLESTDGQYIATLFVTKSVASGIFGYAQASDSTWKSEEGMSYRPATLPYWLHKKGVLTDGSLVPQPQQPYTDAFTGATPQQNVRILSGSEKPLPTQFKVVLEINQTWDWNSHYHNNLYPNNKDYKSSAQPSLVYAVTVDTHSTLKTFHLNPIGHGHFAGEDGLLYTDLSKHTTALNIIDQVRIQIQNAQ